METDRQLDSCGNDHLSKRGTWTKDIPNFMGTYSAKFFADPYHPKNNPQGIMNFGIAENTLCNDILTEKFRTPELNTYEGYMQYYFQFQGVKSFRESLARFLEERFESPTKINPENVIVTAGVGAAIDLLAHMICDAGDCCLVFAPYYAAIAADLGMRAQVTCVPVSLSAGKNTNDKDAFSVDIAETERTIKKAIKEGKRMRMALIINPHNPTGDVLTRNQLVALLDLFNKYDMHVIMDEIYGLSVFTGDPFTSVLSLESVPCPEKIHFVWGFAKDFSLSGFRCGVIHTLHKTIMPAATHLLYMAGVPALVQDKLSKLIDDKEWLDGVYFPENRQRLLEAFTYFKGRLEEMGARVHPAKAGLFIWADLTEMLPAVTKEEEMRLFEELLKIRVYCVPGTSLFYDQAGWFRFTFAHPKKYAQLGLDRLETVLNKRRRMKPLAVENGSGGWGGNHVASRL